MAQGKHMTVKGAAPVALNAFVESRFPERHREWIDALPPSSKSIYSGPILVSNLYPLYDSLIAPNEVMCRLFYKDERQGAWESGKHSAGYALNRFYKVFFKFGSPQFIIDRAARVFSSYYPEGALRVAESSFGRCVLQIYQFPEPYRLLEINIGGWIDGVLELLDKKDKKVEITKWMSGGDPVTEYVADWR